MRKTILAVALAASLSGCAALGALPIIGPVVTAVTAGSVQSIAAGICPAVAGFVITDIENLITNNPTIDAGTLASWLCSTFLGSSASSARLQARLRAGIPTGAYVHGTYIRHL